MDSLYYILTTNLVCLVCFTCLVIIITTHMVKRQNLKVYECILCVLFILGLYLIVPLRLYTAGTAFRNPDLLYNAIKLSINPYEKKLCYFELANIYSSEISSRSEKNGNLAIKYIEKAINGKYNKYPYYRLAYLYLLKGDYDKALETEKNFNNFTYSKYAYVMQRNYEKAISMFDNPKSAEDKFLLSALYKKTGNIEASQKYYKEASEQYNTTLNNIDDEYKKIYYSRKIEDYKTIHAFKEMILKTRKEYNFI